jgi:hypothetical protein
MAHIGSITCLTKSGLSMTDWKPLGSRPVARELTGEQWLDTRCCGQVGRIRIWRGLAVTGEGVYSLGRITAEYHLILYTCLHLQWQNCHRKQQHLQLGAYWCTRRPFVPPINHHTGSFIHGEFANLKIYLAPRIVHGNSRLRCLLK